MKKLSVLILLQFENQIDCDWNVFIQNGYAQYFLELLNYFLGLFLK